MIKLNAIAEEQRRKLPLTNSFSINQLLSMPEFFGWVECAPNPPNETFQMFLGGNDDGVALRFFWNGNYEQTTLKAWSWYSKISDVILDIGTHTGAFTLSALTANPISTVVSFEPHFMNFARLNLNLRANHLATNNIFMTGVGEKNKTLPFSISTSLDYLSTGGSIGDRDEGITTNIEVVALDSFLKNTAKEQVKLIKIDTEGHEAHCLKGMTDVLSNARPVIFFECINLIPGKEVQHILSEFGYHFYYIDDASGEIHPTENIEPALNTDGQPLMHLLNRIAMPADMTIEKNYW